MIDNNQNSLAADLWGNPYAINAGDQVQCPDGQIRTVTGVGRKWLKCEGDCNYQLSQVRLFRRCCPASERSYFRFEIDAIVVRVNVWASSAGEEYTMLEFAEFINDDGYRCEHVHTDELGTDIEAYLQFVVTEMVLHYRAELIAREEKKPETQHQRTVKTHLKPVSSPATDQLSLF
ncbi:MAG: hypothetical protein Kow00121_30350 [Elainellaceae cyanobacterium]